MTAPTTCEEGPRLARRIRNSRIDRLQEARADTAAALAVMIERATWTRDTAMELHRRLAGTGIPGRRSLGGFSGWTANGNPTLYLAPHRTRWRGHPVVYVLMDGCDIVYVGRSNNVAARLHEHKSKKRFDRYHIHPCDSEAEAIDLEAVLIQQHMPEFNIRVEKRPA